MKTLGKLLLVCAFLTGCASTSADRERAQLYLRIGTGYLQQGNYPGAISELLQAERLDPKNPAILNNLGLAYQVRGHLKKAEAKFRLAIRYDRNFSDAKNNLARTLIDQGRSEESIKYLHEAEGDLTYMSPEKTYSNMGMAYFEMGQYKKAENYLLRSLEIRRQSCTTSHYYGRTLQETKRLQESAEALDQAIEFCRGNRFEEPLFYSAMSYYKLGDKEKSRARLEELMKDYPKSKFVAKAKGMLELLEQ